MRVFNEESTKSNECILLAKFDDLKALAAMVDIAVKANPRKKSWKRIQESLELICCY